MKESIWGYAVMTLGILAIVIIWFFANITRVDQHNYNLLKETTEAAMFDAIDLSEYRATGKIKIVEAKFVENFVRRFAQNADLSNTYKIEIYDISEVPPKVSLKVMSAASTTATGEKVEFTLSNNIDSILEATYENSTEKGQQQNDCTEKNHCSASIELVSSAGASGCSRNNCSLAWTISLDNINYGLIAKQFDSKNNRSIDYTNRQLHTSNFSAELLKILNPESVDSFDSDEAREYIKLYNRDGGCWYNGYIMNGIDYSISGECPGDYSLSNTTFEYYTKKNIIVNETNVSITNNVINVTTDYQPVNNKIGRIGTAYVVNFDYWYE